MLEFSSSVLPAPSLYLTFLPQSSQFILAWDRHRKTLNCIPQTFVQYREVMLEREAVHTEESVDHKWCCESGRRAHPSSVQTPPAPVPTTDNISTHTQHHHAHASKQPTFQPLPPAACWLRAMTSYLQRPLCRCMPWGMVEVGTAWSR